MVLQIAEELILLTSLQGLGQDEGGGEEDVPLTALSLSQFLQAFNGGRTGLIGKPYSPSVSGEREEKREGRQALLTVNHLIDITVMEGYQGTDVVLVPSRLPCALNVPDQAHQFLRAPGELPLINGYDITVALQQGAELKHFDHHSPSFSQKSKSFSKSMSLTGPRVLNATFFIPSRRSARL